MRTRALAAIEQRHQLIDEVAARATKIENGGYTVREIHFHFLAGVGVAMHIGEPRRQKLPASVDHSSASRHAEIMADRGDDTLLNQYRLIGDHAFPIHWDHIYVNERRDFGLGRRAEGRKSDPDKDGNRSGDLR